MTRDTDTDTGSLSYESTTALHEPSGRMPEEHTGLMSTIASNIKACRRKLGWSQKELGNQAGLSLKAIGEIERGNRAVSVRSLHQISRALRVTPAELLIPPRISISPLEDQLKRFVLQARQYQVSPAFVELCTKMIEQASHKFAPMAAANGNGNHPHNGMDDDEQPSAAESNSRATVIGPVFSE